MTKEEKRKFLLQAATDVFMELGPHKTTLDDIARQAGMAKTSLYYYFKDKNEIIRAIVKNDLAQLRELVSSAVAAAETAEDKMNALFETRYRFIAEKASRAKREIGTEFWTLSGIFEEEKEQYLQEQKALVEGILSEGIRKGEIKPIPDLELTCLIMISSAYGCEKTFAFYEQPERALEAMKQMGRIFFAGLRNVS